MNAGEVRLFLFGGGFKTTIYLILFESMDFKVVFSVLVPALVAIVGWFVASRISARKDLATRRRELIVSYLIDAYQKIERASNTVASKEAQIAIESAIADIQLFGSSRQVEIAQKLSLEISQNQRAFLTELLEELRHSLRSELELEPVKVPIIHLRFSRNRWLD